MKVAIYCRVSTEEQALGGHSIEAQRQELIKYCSAFDYEIYDFYVDAGFSASTMERPALQKLLADSNKYNIALVWRLDRISRDMTDLMKILEVFENNNVAFKSKTENFDTSTASGRLMLNMLGSFAEFERSSISERIILAHQKILNEGKWRGGPSPFGYNINEDKILVINEDEADIVRLIFAMSANDNIGTRTISVKLNQLGYTTRAGKPFSSYTITRILKNPTYCGYMINGKQRQIKKNGKKKSIYLEDYKTFKGIYEPIVSEETYKRSLKNMEARKQNKGSSSTSGNIFGGLIFCGNCGEYMLRSVSRTKGAFFTCGSYKHYGKCSHHYISEQRIIKEIKKSIGGMVQNQDEIIAITNRAIEKQKSSVKDIERQIAKLKNQLEGFETRENRLFELIEKDIITEEEFINRKSVLGKEKLNINDSLKDLEKQLIKTEEKNNNKDFLQDIKTFNESFDSMPLSDQKKLIKSVIQKINVMGSTKPYERKKIHIYFKI